MISPRGHPWRGGLQELLKAFFEGNALAGSRNVIRRVSRAITVATAALVLAACAAQQAPATPQTASPIFRTC